MSETPSIKPYGDSGILISWPQVIDDKTNEEVVTLAKQIEGQVISGINEMIIAYQSICIQFDSLVCDYNIIVQELLKVIESETSTTNEFENKLIEIPVCYDSEFALDREYLKSATGLPWEEIVSLHSNQTYSVYMTGFTPGFAYLGTLPETLEVPRKDTPRTQIPAGSIAIAGKQTGVYSLPSPGGWQIIGRTPIELLDLSSDSPFNLEPGSNVVFKEISLEEFKKWE
ncbi:MAG: 5-oxoprolinase subunit PxpB [bacterium]|nr:5-oxoprolinase subunit PxpB [bacterium]